MSSLYKRTEIVGRGKFGVVYKGFNKQTKQIVAIKVLNLDTQEDEVNEVQQEIAILTDLKNVPNVTHYYGCFLNDMKLWIIMDYCAGGSIRTLLKPGVFEEKYIGVIVRELLIALSAVHKLGVIHRDIKSANVLITKEGNVQLCDFGVAAKITSNAIKRTTMAGTPYWMAPEVIREGDTYNSKADIWSLGITIYEIATGNPPYCDKDAMWAMQLISKSQPPRLEGREYSPVLRECIALCLDENPQERPSADDLMKCRLVKIYKSYPKSILKEVITRYLLWRDRNSNRDSVFVKLDEKEENNDDNDLDNTKVHVKWDFDSLSSREYIIENDIDLEKVEELPYNEEASDYRTLTFKDGLTKNNSFKSNNFTKTSTMTNTLKQSNPEIPKSLQLLFEDNDEQDNDLVSSSNFEPPPVSSNAYEKIESPTIEIPDMDNLATYQPTNSHPALNKPPTLYHSQSASASLESRLSNNSNNSSGSIRPVKKSIQPSHSTSNIQNTSHAPHTPPYVNNPDLKTPSPKPPSTSVLLNSGGKNSGSPSKSMKALNTTSNPLLQPINFKSNGDTNVSTSNNSNQGVLLANNTTNNNSVNHNSTVSKSGRRKPGFHIQMPTPSTTLNALSALTNEGFDKQDEDVNQFGINASQAANLPISMTPVSEGNPIAKDMESHVASTRDRTDSASQFRSVTSRKQSSTMSGSTSDIQTSAPNNLPLPRAVSVGGISPNNAVVSNAAINHPLRFPTIPQINGEFFMDSTPKAKLINELDNIIKLFNQGLEALEDVL